eukprot:351077-Chlamydomonas_euryale.AAC.5
MPRRAGTIHSGAYGSASARFTPAAYAAGVPAAATARGNHRQQDVHPRQWRRLLGSCRCACVRRAAQPHRCRAITCSRRAAAAAALGCGHWKGRSHPSSRRHRTAAQALSQLAVTGWRCARRNAVLTHVRMRPSG